MSVTHEFEEKDTRTILTEIVIRIMNEDQANPDEDRWHRQFAKEVSKLGLRSAADSELFDLLTPFACGKAAPKKAEKKKPKIVPGKAIRDAESLLRRLKREAEAVAYVEKRLVLRITEDCTMHELWKMGSAARKLGKRGDKRLVTKVLSEAQLEKAGIGKD